jgi:hypothetical protein
VDLHPWFRRLTRTATRHPPLRLDTYKEEDDDDDDEDLGASIFDLSGDAGAAPTCRPLVDTPTASPTEVDPEGTANVPTLAPDDDPLAAFYAQSPLTPASAQTSFHTFLRQQREREPSCSGISAAKE